LAGATGCRRVVRRRGREGPVGSPAGTGSRFGRASGADSAAAGSAAPSGATPATVDLARERPRPPRRRRRLGAADSGSLPASAASAGSSSAAGAEDSAWSPCRWVVPEAFLPHELRDLRLRPLPVFGRTGWSAAPSVAGCSAGTVAMGVDDAWTPEDVAPLAWVPVGFPDDRDRLRRRRRRAGATLAVPGPSEATASAGSM